MNCSCSNWSSSPIISSDLPFRFPGSSFPSNFAFSTLKGGTLVKQQLLVVKSASGSDENGSVNGFPVNLFMREAIGAEYGEGFETFRQDGPLKVDMETLQSEIDRLRQRLWR